MLNSFTVQPFINYNLPHAWAISTAPLITSNWSAPSGQRWTVPIGAGVSKVTHVGEQPLNLELQYYHNVKSSETRPAVSSCASRWRRCGRPPPQRRRGRRKAKEAEAKKKSEKPEE